MQYGPSIQTADIETQNVRTNYDAYTTTPNRLQPNGARNPVAAAYYDDTATTTYVNGVPAKYRYLRYNSSNNATVVAYPAPVFYSDIGRTTVTSKMSEGYTATQQDLAGWLMPNSGDLTSLTAALLNGNWVWVCVAGLVTGAASAGSVVKGDWLIGGATPWVPVRVQPVTGTGYLVGAYALTNVSSSKSDIIVLVESL